MSCRYGDLEIDLGQPFRRATMYDLVHEATGCNFWELRGDAVAFREAAEAAAPGVTARHGGDGDGTFSSGRIINDLFEDLVEGTLQQVWPRGAFAQVSCMCLWTGLQCSVVEAYKG